MRKVVCVTGFVLAWLLFCGWVFAADEGPVAWWKFEDGKSKSVLDGVSGIEDQLKGFSKYVKGSSGKGLRFDGFTTTVVRKAQKAPKLGDAFTFEAWIAIQAYPWGHCAILNQENDQTTGYFFGVDARGYVHVQLAVDGKWRELKSSEKIGLLKWAHIAGTYNVSEGMAVYINGKNVGSKSVTGKVTFASDIDLQLGRNHKERPPEYPIRINIPASYSFDGYIDEVKIYNRALSAAEIEKAYEATKPSGETGMTFRRLPSEPNGPAPFGAYYCKMKFCETWDTPRREGPDADVAVLFDEAPYRFVFWRGTGYIPHWVTENEIWYTNEFNETWGHGALGCAEPMSDKQCRHSHVRIIENSSARVVVHWRYGLIDTRYIFARVDETTGWGDWSDEYHTIYPDGVGIRKINLWSSQPMEAHEFQESIILNQPGTRPEDNIETKGLTMVNMKGQSHTYSWAEGPPDKINKPENANIEYINIKSKHKPFLIVSPKPWRKGAKGPRFKPYRGEIIRANSIFPWWNHWPVAQIPSDGRWAHEPDRTAHSSLTTGLEWENYEVTENTRVRIMMHGLTAKPAVELVPLARSWLQAPKLKLASPGFSSEGYEQAERAYLLTCNTPGRPFSLGLELLASEDSPIVNPAFIIKNWGQGGARLHIDGQRIRRGRNFRLGHRHRLEGSDLIVWVKKESTKPIKISLSPVGG